MPEPITPAPAPAPVTNPPAPVTPPVTPPASEFDTSKIGDEDFNKVLEDPRLWKNPRIAELREQAKKAKALEDAQKAAADEQLKKQGEYQKLAEQKEAEAKTLKETLNKTVVDNAILAEAAKKGISRVDLVQKLIDRSSVKVNDDGTVEGIATALDALVKENEFLIKNTTVTVGSGTNPGSVTPTSTFKLSQLKDVAFFQANEKAIKAAMAIPGAIIDDTN